MREHQEDLNNAENNTAIARLALNQNIKTDFNKTKTFSNYNNRTYECCRETIEIKKKKQ